jgi:hypothetical protein
VKTFWQWAAVFLAATIIDLLIRFGMPFRMPRVLAAEAILFPAAALAFLILLRRGPTQAGFRRKLQILLIGAFFLAGLRSGLWATGVPVGIVNLLVLAAAVLAWVAYRLRRRAAAGSSAPRRNPPHS